MPSAQTNSSWLDELLTQLRLHANPEQAVAMSAYMRGRFAFLGLQTPQRRALAKKANLHTRQLSLEELWRAIDTLYALPEREFHYTALDMLERNHKRFQLADIDRMLDLIDQHAWWDSVDTLRKSISLWLKINPSYLPTYMARLLAQESFWQRRVAITLQLGWREKTDQVWLERVIFKNINDREFFIQKGIGWALRDYSKYNAQWVQALFSKHSFGALAIREGSKYINP